MGYAYAVCVLKKDNPKVAILNIGHEDTKGTEDLKIASEKLSSIFKSDYIVTDNYTRNHQQSLYCNPSTPQELRELLPYMLNYYCG